MSARQILLLIIILSVVQNIFGSGKIDEADVPMPETYYELPENLIGDFILINHWAEREIKIFSNNKFISWQDDGDSTVIDHFGYIIENGSTWYLIPSDKLLNNRYRPHPFLSEATEIFLTDMGFSFYDKGNNELNVAIRKIDLSEMEIKAKDLSIEFRKAKQEYYFFEHTDGKQLIEFSEIPYIDSFPPFYYTLELNYGILNIDRLYYRDNGTIGSIYPKWKGFFEQIVKTEDTIRGTIRFTNGVPYYYTKDGTAILEMENDSITITMECSAEEEKRIRNKIPEAQSPIFLRLEF